MKHDNWSIIILGASGDLSKTKLIPALYNLLKQHSKLNFIFVGAANTDTTIDQILEDTKKNIKDIESMFWDQLKVRSYYHKLNFDCLQDFKNLEKLLKEYEKKYNLPGNRLIYLAAYPNFYCDMTTNLALSGIAQRESKLKNITHRIVYEKPFGWSLKSVTALNKCIEKYFDESQVYRIDHYLTKPLINSIAAVRFTNILFKSVWNKSCISEVQIILNETETLEDRAGFYDKYGALKDVVQNHMLQMFALIAMEPPKTLNSEDLSNAKAQVLKDTIICDGILGQYKSYKELSDIKHDSKTETFATLLLKVDNPRWKGIPFYIKTGKALAHDISQINVVFKAIAKDSLFEDPGSYEPNILTIRNSPHSGFSLQLNAQKIKQSECIVPVEMDFCYKCRFGNHIPQAYEVLLYEILTDSSIGTVNTEEIKYSWYIIEKIQSLELPVYTYIQGTQGPVQADVLNNKKINWYL